MLEKEYKCMLDRDTYEKLKAEFIWDSAKEQTNSYYFGESGELSKRRITVRVREKDGKHKLQVKIPQESETALHVSEEREFDIDGAPETIDSEKGFEITGINTGRLVKIGTLKTLRHSLMWDSGTEICLDKSEYFDCIDYEIEVEYEKAVPQKLISKLEEIGVNFQVRTVGKYTRFLRKFKSLVRGNKE